MLQMRVISLLINCMLFIYIVSSHLMSHCGRNCMVFEFTTTCAIKPITSKVVSANPTHGEVYSIQHYVIKFVSDLQQVGGFLLVLSFPQPIKLTTTI
jgi:hypothetical protein